MSAATADTLPCCGHDAERHGPDAGGCIECRCTVGRHSSTVKAMRADLARLNDALHKLDAVRTEEDGFTWVDESKVPAAVMRTYHSLVSAMYATPGAMA